MLSSANIKPLKQPQVNEPGVLVQVWAQLESPSWHSSMSANLIFFFTTKNVNYVRQLLPSQLLELSSTA